MVALDPSMLSPLVLCLKQDGLSCPTMAGSHPLDLDPGFHQLPGAPETIRATLLPRTWSGSNRTLVRLLGLLFSCSQATLQC